MGYSNGKITAPVSITDIAMAVGKTTDISRSPHIKRYAKYKPFESYAANPHAEQTEVDRKQGAYGFYWWNMSAESNAPIARSAEDCLAKAKSNNGAWLIKPHTIARMGDFIGYDNQAKPPYGYTNPSPVANNQKYLGAYLERDNSGNIKLSDMPDMADASDIFTDFRIVVIYRLNTSTGAVSYVDTGYTVADFDMPTDIGNVEVTLTPVTDGSSRVYDMTWAATNYYDNPDDAIWVYLPEGYDTLTVKAAITLQYEYAAGGFEVESTSGTQITGSSSLIVGAIQPYLEGSMNLNYGIDLTYTFRMWDRTMDSGYDGALEYSESMTLGADAKYSIDPYIEVSIGEVSATVLNFMITLDIQFRRSGSTEAWTYRHFDFVNDKLVQYASGEADGVTLLTILNKING